MSEYRINVSPGQNARLLTSGTYCPNDILVTVEGNELISAQEKDINFYDYDGTCLYSYTLSEIQQLTQLPALPTHRGLVCQGWNWTLEEIKAQRGIVDVGAMYITDDGKTRLYIKIPTDAYMNIPLYFYQSAENGVVINWGDNSSDDTVSAAGWINTQHTYTTPGDYIITLSAPTKVTVVLGNNSTSTCILGDRKNYAICSMLQKVEFGSLSGDINAGTFYNCYNLKSITISPNVRTIHAHAFNACISLLHLTVPNSVTRLRGFLAYSCYSSKSISLPPTLTATSDHEMSACYSLLKVALPDAIQSLGYGLFQSTMSVSKLALPASLTSISGNAFYGMSSVKVYDFTRCTQIPALAATSAFSGISDDCEILVPTALYDEWISATNWATYADYIAGV